MELEYKLAAIIGSCVNEGQLFTARECVLQAGNRLTSEEYVYLRKLADHKEVALKNQMVKFANDTENVAAVLQCTMVNIPVTESCGLVALEPIDVTAENVAKVAAGIKYVNDIDAD
jgi:hypothetical protein